MTERNLQGFATIPRSVLHDPNVPTDAKMIYLVLSSYVGQHDGVWPSHKTIATDAGLSVSTVKRQLRVLRDRGLIRWANHVAPGTEYRTINTYELIATTPTPQQTPIVQPDPKSSLTLSPVRAIRESGQVTQDLGSERATNERPTSSPTTACVVGSNSPSVDAAKKRGARLPEDWNPSPGNIAWQRGQCIPDEFARVHTANFVDHWLSESGQRAAKLDWGRAWQKWMRTEWDRASRSSRRDFQAEREQQIADQVKRRQSDRLASAR